MAKYRKVSVQIWNDDKFREFTDDGKLAFLFLLTHQHMTAVGGMRITIEGIAAELKWTRERVSKGFQKGFESGMIWYDQTASCIILPNFIKHNEPENPNVVKGWKGALELIPECAFKARLYSVLADYIQTQAEPFRKAFETVSKPFRKPEPEQEPEQEQEPKEDRGGAAAPRRPKKLETPPPDSIELTSELIALARENSVQHPEEEAQAMLDHFRSKGVLRADWLATLRNWFRNHKKFGGGNNGNRNTKSKHDRNVEAARELLSELHS